ncbi:MAG: hypothetical protein WA635_02280 [Gallionella sp.]
MSYKVTSEQKAGYMHAVVTGTNSKENVMSYLADILHECMDRDCFRVLIEERLEGPRLNTTEVYEIASQEQAHAARRRPVIAYVDVNALNLSNMKFAEDVAVNRGKSVRVFPTVTDAARWLEHLDDTGTRPDAASHANKQ